MRDMTRWLGDGGMPVLADLGLRFEPAEPGSGGFLRSVAIWQPTAIACNPAGVVQGGFHTVVMDAAIGFAVNANLDPPARLQATLEIKTDFLRAATVGAALSVWGNVSRMSRLIAYTMAEVADSDGRCVSRATATVLVHRPADDVTRR